MTCPGHVEPENKHMKTAALIGIAIGCLLFGGCAPSDTSTDKTTVTHDGSTKTETHTKTDTTTPGIPAAPNGTTTTTTTGQ